MSATSSSTFDPFAKLISGRGSGSNVPQTAAELKEAVEKLPTDQNTIFRRVYKKIRTAMKDSSKEVRTEYIAFLKQMITKLGSDVKVFNEDEPKADKLIFEQTMKSGQISKALALYPTIEKDVRNDLKGLLALEQGGFRTLKITRKGLLYPLERFLRDNDSTIGKVQKIIGDPLHFTTLTPTQHSDLREVGTVEPLYFLLRQKVGDQSTGCKERESDKLIKLIFPDLDMNVVNRFCNFAETYKTTRIAV